MRLVFDTNVLIDGFKDHFSVQAKLIDAIRDGQAAAIVTPATLREYHRLVNRLVENDEWKNRIREFLQAAEEVESAGIGDIIIDDPEDVKFLEAAVGGQADILITNDRHLLDVGRISQTAILTPAEAYTRFTEESEEESSAWQNFVRGLGIGIVIAAAIGTFAPPHTASAADTITTVEELQQNQQAISDKEKEIAEINKKIQALTEKRDTTAAEAELITSQVTKLNASLDKAQLELKATKLSLTKVQAEQTDTAQDITAIQTEVGQMRDHLRALVRQLHSAEQVSFVQIFFSSFSLSDVLSERAAYEELQDRTITLIQELHTKEINLKEKEQALTAQETELAQLEKIQAAQQAEVAAQQAEQKDFLNAKKSEQAGYESKLKEAREAREEIAKNVFTLKSSGVELTFTSALDMAKYASSLTGVSPALLMAVLKVESNLGASVGSGKYPDDMQPASREAFVRLTDKLGLDRATAQISRRPASGRGWGGAMGPAQIMPATWEGIEPRIEQLTKKSPVNPYELSDAFVATGIFLADRGASAGREREALARYVAGPNWQYWVNSWYTDKIVAVAGEYEKELE